jgi:hypothetical protein
VINKAKKFVRMLLRNTGFDIRRVPSPNSPAKSYSNLDEQSILRRFLDELSIGKGFCVDIGASDGVSMSNTLALYMNGWNGLAVEMDPAAFSALAAAYINFPNVLLAKRGVTPSNVVPLLAAFDVPGEFEVLSLDIDGYDYFVLEQILTRYRPALICTEINENIPPPVKFTVKWNPGYAWQGDHFFGQSISQLQTLCARHKYALVELHYNNAFLIPRELSRRPDLSAEQAYQSGYLNKPDRRAKFPWNNDMEELLHMKPGDALEFLKAFFEKYNGMFDASI